MNILKQTYIGKKIPKKRFYENIKLSNKLQKKFVNYIDSIILLNKFSKDNLNILKSKEVEEIFIFEIKLKSNEYLHKVEELLEIIDRNIQYHILFKIILENKIVCKIGHKIRNQSDSSKYVVDTYFTKKFNSEKEFEKKILTVFNAINMKALYENILKLFLDFKGRKIEEKIKKQKNYEFLKQNIKELKIKLDKEKQADRQYEIHKELNIMKKELKKYENN